MTYGTERARATEINRDPDAFLQLFRDFAHTAFRLEVRAGYGVADEDAPYQQFLAGEDPGIEWLRPWLDLMSEQTGQGKRVERVRVVDEPPSDYLRWELVNTPHNLRAGEDIRYLTRRRAEDLGLPPYDYWVFDSSLLVFLRFGDDDRFLGFDSTREPAALVEHLRWRDAAWHHALTYARYADEHVAEGSRG
ncbi:DUF6879 family protein [Streptomyces sp. 6N223]|uniref:DUF6879 family protein n=1 Tax=Streptomyces sp. 6N223 TaxID=3457412 RepID=UPI003FCF5B7C